MKNTTTNLVILVILTFSAFTIQSLESMEKFAKEKIEFARAKIIKQEKPEQKTEEPKKVLNMSQLGGICSLSEIDKEQKYEEIIQALKDEIEKLKSQEPKTKIKEVIKEVPVEKIVVREVIKKEECNYNTPYIKFVDVTTTANSAIIKWETDKVTKSEVSINGGSFAEPTIFPSAFGSASKHRVDINSLTPLTFYNYEIRAFVIKNGEVVGTAKKSGGFATTQVEEE